MSRIPIFLAVILCIITTVSSSSISTTHSDLPTTFQRPSFQSKALSHIEHVEWYHLDHEDRHLYNTESVHTGTGLKSHVSYPFASRRMRTFNGMNLHFPEHVHLSVRALGQTYYLSLHLVSELKAENSTVITADGSTFAASLTTYRTYRRKPSDTWAVVTFRSDGTFQGLLVVDDEVIGIDHVEQHEQEMESHHYHSMATSAPHGMIAYKYSSFRDTHVHGCGVVHEETNKISTEPMTPNQMRRHLLQTINDPKNGICDGLPCRWLDDGAGAPCWPGITATNVKSMTFIPMADYGFYQIYNSVANTQSAIDQTIAVINGIYVPQIGIFNKVIETVIMDAAGKYTWNKQPPSKGAKCSDVGYSIDQQLNDLTAYNKQDLVNGVIKASERHIFTNCFPPAGTVGLAWVGTINARGGNGCGVSSYSSSHWLTIAHEVGHNLGAPHTFGPDGTDPNSGVTGQVGGIMDYTQTGKFPRPESGLPGIPQFHPVITRPKICNQLKVSMTNDRSYVLAYMQPWTPTCKNGILEPGEDCDDTSGCCDLSSCRLVPGAQCTPGKGNSNPCCDPNTCLYKSTQYGCPGGNSYCLMGQCANDGCTKYSNTAQCPNQQVKPPDYPGVATTDGCNFGCTYSTVSACSYPPRASPGSFGTIPDGAVCNDGTGTWTGTTGGKYGVCQGAKCVATTAPKPAVKYGDVGFVTAAPTNAPPTAAPTQPAGPVTAKPTTPVVTVAPTPGDVYSWIPTSAFSACFDSSGVKTAGCNIAGTQVRSVACRNSAGTQVPDIYCSNLQKPATSQACRGECTYAWYADPKGWSACNYDCTSPGISPTQTRAIFCYEQGDTTRSNPLSTDPVTGPCYQTVPPASVQSCNQQACPVKLNIPEFDAVCSKDCGGGVQTRTITCVYTQNGRQYNVPMTSTDSRWSSFISACNTLKTQQNPITSQSCNVQACAQFNWRASNFGACSATCKAASGPIPTRTRTVACVESNNGVDTNVADNKCDASIKPVTVENCNTQACAIYSWVLGDWSTCNAKCGGGLQTRSVVCKDGAGNAASDNTCTDSAKPISQQTCNTQLCDLFAWRTSEYGVCTVTCGGGTQTRTVSCYNTILPAPQPTVDDSNCATAGPKPAIQQACSLQACPRYDWLAGDYGNCDKICGVGTRTRTVKCIQIGPNDIVSDSLCTGTKPATSGACNTNPCQQSNWRTGAWGACSQTCGAGGVRTRVVDCVDQSSNPAQGCDPAIKPASQEACNTQTCPTQWLAGPFGQCSKPCGVGTYTRSVTCVYRDTQKPTGDDSLCSSTQPTSSSVCNTFACPTYRAGAWGPCRSPLGCGDGIQTRPLTCFDSFGTQVDIKECASATAPFTQQTCSLDPCPHWHRDPWNDCSQPCGGGTQTRSLTCRMPHDAIWQGQKALNESLCPDINISGADGDAADSKSGLATIQACNTDPCASYYWNTTYGACSKDCGGGIQLATSVCYSNDGKIASNQALCTAPKPPPQRDCNTYLCPNYIWKAKEWSQCSVYCGTGTQTRQVYCANISPNAAVLQETVADSFCDALGLPKLPSQQNCVNPSDKCAGARPGQVDGVCVTDTNDPLFGKCKCRYGFAGADCKEAPSIYDVTTDAGRVGVGVGVPIGDSLSISWKTTGKIDSVSIVLGQRGGRNPISRYVIANKPLKGTASWTVGIGADGFPMKNLLPGSGYFITVFALNSIQGSSAEFAIGDACSTKSCGYGTCVAGTCVCQDAYTGDKCDIPRCTTSNCNANGGTCSLTKQPSGSFCQCEAGWQGISCGTPKTCTATCGTGGDMAPFPFDDPTNPACPTQAQCICLPNYVYTGGICKCDPGCGPYGTPASDCSGCNCLPGWFGQKCDRIYWTLRTQFIITSGTSFLQDATLKADFGRTTSIDLATAAGFPIERIILDDISVPGPTTAIVSFRLLSVASIGAQALITSASEPARGQRSGIFNPAAPTAEHHALAARRAAIALQADGLTPNQVSQIAELKQAYAILAAVLADASSYAWNGVGTNYMDRSYAITVSDASGKSGTLPSPPPKPDTPFTPGPGGQQNGGSDGGSSSSSSSSMIIIIAAAVAGGIVALIVLAIIIYFCKRSSQQQTWAKDSAKMEMRTFDSFNAGGNTAAWASPSSAAIPASSGVASWAKGMSSPSTPAVVSPTSYAAAASPTSYTASNVGYNAYTSPANTTGYSQQEGYTANTTAVEANPLTLPPGWTQQFTNDGTPYYFNSLTSQTQWERPGTY